MMDERQQQQYPQQFDHAGRPLQQPHAPMAPRAPVPWPDQQRPHQQFSADVHSQQRYQQPSGAQQSGGFVQPGQPAMQPQLGVHHGVIGQPQPLPVPPGFQQQHVTQPGTYPPSHVDPRVQPQQQQYAFATPQGVQVISSNGGAAHALSYQQQLHAAHQPMVHQQHLHQVQQPLARPFRAQVPPIAMRRSRMRWEVIVPLAAVFCLLVAVGVLALNFDEITGRTKDAASTGTKQVAGAGDSNAAAADSAAVEADARRLMRLGRYDEALATLAPLTTGAQAAPKLVQLADVITARGARNDALLERVGRQRSTGHFIAALATLKQIEELHPLSPSLIRLRAQLMQQQRSKAAGSAVDKAFAKATDQFAAGSYDAALTTVDAALVRSPNRRLEQLRSDIIAARDAAGSGAGRGTPPQAPGSTSSGGTNTKPPASGPQKPGGLPPVPNVPNTGGGGTDVNGGQPSTTGHAGMPHV